MPLAFTKERKQNERNSLLDFRLQGTQLTLHSRPLSASRSVSRIDTTFRPMSATPTLYHQEKHRKTPPWMRPQSADHLSTRNNPRRKIAAKFDGSRKNSKGSRKAGGSMSNLLESSSMEDALDSETSVTPSPVPSLMDVLRSSAKLEPGLAAKPPLPPVGGGKKNKSMDDIINIKFQRWFPESIQNGPPYARTIAAISSSEAFLHNGDTVENDIEYAAELLGQTDIEVMETAVIPGGEPINADDARQNYASCIKFDAYEGTSRTDNVSKSISKSRTMETIQEKEDGACSVDYVDHRDRSQEENSVDGSQELLTSKIGRSLNRYLHVDDGAPKDTSRKNSTHSKDPSEESGIVSMIERSDSPAQGHPMLESSPSQTLGIAKVLEDENAACLVKYMDDEMVNMVRENRPGSSKESGLNNEDILSWMGRNQESDIGNKNIVGSTCDDILNMIKVLEKEEAESVKLEALSAGRSGNNSVCSNVTPVGTSSREILTFLDELDQNEVRNEYPSPEVKTPAQATSEPNTSVPNTGRMGQLMAMNSAELAKRVMALTLELEEREAVLMNTNQRLNETQEKLAKQKTDNEATVKRHQKFIDQLLTEKKLLGEQCATVIKEMEEKHAKVMQNFEERHKIEMKKFHEKITAAEKIKREKWIEERMKKVKEQTVKGLEPELERITRAHQEELAEIRRAHEKELAEMEASSSRRISMSREQALRDREQAVAEEREAARKKLEHELSEVERSYQDQRRRLLAEVREEKLRMERDLENSMTVKSRQLEEKWQQANQELESRMAALQEKHQAELKNMRETLEGERQSWLNHQTQSLSQKEAEIREQLKKEKDHHVEIIMKKMEEEMQVKAKALEHKIAKIREQYESDLKDLEASQGELRRKLKESRTENQQNEDILAKLRTQISQLEGQLTTTKQRLERAEKESSERGAMARSEASSHIINLQRELAEERARREETISSMQMEKERELQQVYNRVKEAIGKKEEALKMVQKQRDAALEQCCQLESMLEQQRKDFLSRKSH